MAETQDVSSGVTSPAVVASSDASASSAGQESNLGSSQTAGDVTAAGGQDNSGIVNSQEGTVSPPPTEDDLFKDVPSVDELKAQAQNKVQYAAALANLRPAYEALKSEHGTLKTTFEPLQPLLEKHDVAEIQSNLELLDALSSPVLDNGQPRLDPNTQLPVTTASPFIDKLATTSPEQARGLIQAALDYPMLGQDGVTTDTALNWALRDLGVDPQDIENYKTWKAQGAPVAESVDLSAIPEPYRDTFKTLPAKVQSDISNLISSANQDDKDLAQWHLDQAKERFDGRQAQEKFQQQERLRVENEISTATDKAIDGKFQEGFNQFLQHVSSWQPTADPNINAVYHIELASSLVNLLDARMGFANQMLLEKAGIPPDPQLLQLNESFQRNTDLAKRYEVFGRRPEAAQAQKQADNDYLRLTTKLQGVAAKLMEYKTKVARVEQGAAEAASLQSRPSIGGAPAGQNGNAGTNPDWYKAYVRT